MIGRPSRRQDAYLVVALTAYREGIRQASTAQFMRFWAQTLTADDIRAAAIFYSALRPIR
jgi:cytochrome c553